MDLAILVSRFSQLFFAPFNYPEIIWFVLPLGVSMILIEFYFGRYANEQLGWNSAVSNSMVLIFVGIDLLRKTIDTAPFSLEFLISLSISILGVLFLYVNFFHKVPDRLAFVICSVIPINTLAYLAIVFVYSDIPFDLVSIIASVLIIFSLWILFQIIHLFERAFVSKIS